MEQDIELLVEPTNRGDPESPLRYTIKSTRVLEEELKRRGHHVSYPTIASLLHQKGYSFQANKKTLEGSSHPDRNAQFEFINKDVKIRQRNRASNTSQTFPARNQQMEQNRAQTL